MIMAASLLTSASSASSSSSLPDLYINHDHYYIDKVQHYIEYYDELFSKLRYEPIHLVELGVQNGGSLELWKKYFSHPNTKITGIDINEKVCELEFESGIETFCFNLGHPQSVLDWNDGRSFTIVIDDASHIQADVILDFSVFFKNLVPGGLYIVEDICTSYWEPYSGGLGNPQSMLEFFKLLLDIINIYYIQKADEQIYSSKYVGYLGAEFVDYFAACIEEIRFLDNLIIVKKRMIAKTSAGIRINSGRVQHIVPLDNSKNMTPISL